MLATFGFSLDSTVPPQNCALSGMVAGDRATVVALGPGFDAADVITQAAFTAKVLATDADNASSTIQKILVNGDGTANIDALGTIRSITFELTPTDTAALVISRVYDIRLWVTRSGQTYDRLVQRGAISVQTL